MNNQFVVDNPPVQEIGHSSKPSAIHMESLFSQCLGDRSFALMLLGELENCGIKHLESLIQHTVNLNYTQIAEVAHSLKGAAATLGAQTLHLLAAEIEQAGTAEEIQQVPILLEQLSLELERCKQQISEFRDQQNQGAVRVK